MESESKSDYLRICDNYFQILNKVNLLLAQEHHYKSQQQIYQQQLSDISQFINELKQGKTGGVSLSAQREHKYLQQLIKCNKGQIMSLQHKLQTKDNLIKQLQNLKKNCQDKYLKLISLEYQSSLQQKLSVIRGKVDDLKKKIKQINKQINASEQQHKQLMDDYSCQSSYLKDIQARNQGLKGQVEQLRQLKIKREV